MTREREKDIFGIKVVVVVEGRGVVCIGAIRARCKWMMGEENKNTTILSFLLIPHTGKGLICARWADRTVLPWRASREIPQKSHDSDGTGATLAR
jgi:hypothetical protein